MNFKKVKVPYIDFARPKLSEKNRASFRNFWKYYCKDLSPKKAIGYLAHSFPEHPLEMVMEMYREWRQEYLVSEEW